MISAELSKRLEPGERVIYRTRHSLMAWRRPVIWGGFWLAIIDLFIFLVIKDQSAAWSWISIFTIVGALAALSDLKDAKRCAATTVLLTDRRLLYQTGMRKPEILILPLSDVEVVRYHAGNFNGFVYVRLRSLAIIQFENLKNPRPLFEAIADHMPQHPSTKPPLRMKMGHNFLHIILVIFVLPVGILYLWAIMMLIDSDYFHYSIELVICLGSLPFMIVGLFASGMLAVILGFVVLRPFLSAQEALDLLCVEEGAIGNGLALLFTRFQIPICERLISVLYGRHLRCRRALASNSNNARLPGNAERPL